MGAGRTEVARAIIGADSTDERHRRDRRQGLSRIKQPADAVANGIGYLSEDRKAARSAARARRQHQHRCSRRCGTTPTSSASCAPAKARRPRAGYVESLRIKTPSINQIDQESLRRKPAEGGHRQVAGPRLRHPHLRRAHPWHRRRREGRDLPPAQRARRAGQVHHHDLVGAARGPAAVPSHRRDGRRTHHRSPRQRGCQLRRKSWTSRPTSATRRSMAA